MGGKTTGNPYKEAKYGVYHNVLLDILRVIGTSASSQDKIDAIQEKIINARSESAVLSFKIEKQLFDDA